MINPTPSSVQSASTLAASAAGQTGSTARNAFKSILSELGNRPLKPLAVQRFAGLSSPVRSLAQQIDSDTRSIA